LYNTSNSALSPLNPAVVVINTHASGSDGGGVNSSNSRRARSDMIPHGSSYDTSDCRPPASPV
jgi:hypothetical protein